ncbi:MAG: precorrin-6y C5,15-methyltransferase (decarboxylating) subunit CbiE [Burkholderiales bacterium]|nr:precorrin-6y C5,15-methyltransferase (decarboxylating) subunit CbiE [Burkholderiales bacterium]
MTPPCRIIGVLDDGAASLGAQALQHLRQAQVVIGAQRTLALFAQTIAADALQRDMGGALGQVAEWVRQARADGLRVVVLATGDPLCYGIAPFLAARLCVEAIEVLPNVSTLQLACARLQLPWQDMRLASVHAKDAGEWVVGSAPSHGLYALLRDIRQYDRLAVLTSPDNTPERIARMLVAEGLDEDFEMAVAERLCLEDERVVQGLPVRVLAQARFADPNVVLLWRRTARALPVLFGVADDQFAQRSPEKGLITKNEVRAVSLARMQLRENSVVWDIGAGSGSVGLEAARLCRQGHVYAIEKNADDVENVRTNRAAWGVGNVTVVHGKAPEGLDAWMDPDAVFIGGSGGELAELIALVLRRLRPQGWLVMNFVTLENLSTAVECLKALGADWDVVQLQAARSKPILHMHRMAAENPVWVVCAQAPVAGQSVPGEGV